MRYDRMSNKRPLLHCVTSETRTKEALTLIYQNQVMIFDYLGKIKKKMKV
jgi:hypothetical protein